MAGKKKAAIPESGFAIFNKPGKEGNRIAIDMATGAAIEEAGKAEFYIYIGGHRHIVTAGDNTLETLTGVEEAAEE